MEKFIFNFSSVTGLTERVREVVNKKGLPVPCVVIAKIINGDQVSEFYIENNRSRSGIGVYEVRRHKNVG